MDANSIGIIIGVLSIVATWIVSKYFHERGEKEKKLTITCEQADELIEITSSELINKLELFLDGEKIKNLVVYKFLVQNSGGVAISNLLEPLKFHLPENHKLVDFKIEKIKPEGRNASLEFIKEENVIVVHFDLLNKNESILFSAKFTSNDWAEEDMTPDNKEILPNFLFGKPKLKHMNKHQMRLNDSPIIFLFTVVGEELPPYYSISGKGFASSIIKGLDVAAMVYKLFKGLIYMAIGYLVINLIFTTLLLVKLGVDNDRYNIFQIKTFFMGFNCWSFVILVSWLSIFLLIFFTLVFLISKRKEIEKESKKGPLENIIESQESKK